MESWLTFCVRLVVVAFVGAILWFLFNSMDQSFGSNLEGAFRRSLGLEPLPVEELESVEQASSLVNITAFFAGMTVLAGVMLLVETLRYGRFKQAVRDVQGLQGRVQFGASDVPSLANFYFGKPTVDLSEAKLIGAKLPALERLPVVLTIRLCNAEVDGEMLEVVGRCRKLRSLDLSGTNVGDSEVAELGVLPKLEVLFLSHTNVTNKVLGFLMHHPLLENLEYKGTQITDQAVEAFCDRR